MWRTTAVQLFESSTLCVPCVWVVWCVYVLESAEGVSRGAGPGGGTTNGDNRTARGRCGLCALVARALRRAVCGTPSRRGSGDSYQELTNTRHLHEPEHLRRTKKNREGELVVRQTFEYRKDQEEYLEEVIPGDGLIKHLQDDEEHLHDALGSQEQLVEQQLEAVQRCESYEEVNKHLQQGEEQLGTQKNLVEARRSTGIYDERNDNLGGDEEHLHQTLGSQEKLVKDIRVTSIRKESHESNEKANETFRSTTARRKSCETYQERKKYRYLCGEEQSESRRLPYNQQQTRRRKSYEYTKAQAHEHPDEENIFLSGEFKNMRHISQEEKRLRGQCQSIEYTEDLEQYSEELLEYKRGQVAFSREGSRDFYEDAIHSSRLHVEGVEGNKYLFKSDCAESGGQGSDGSGMGMCEVRRRRSGNEVEEEHGLEREYRPEEVTIVTNNQNSMYIRMVGPPDTAPLGHPRLSLDDYILLDTLAMQDRHPSTGRFLTMHKRRRKRLTTRSLQPPHGALLDDVQHGPVHGMLARCGLWAFNAFALETCAGGRSLPVLCVHLFHWYGLLEAFRLDVVRVWKLFSLIEEGYHSTNPYHNSIHATDVTQAMHCFLQEEKIRKHLTPLEVMASLIGAVAHDLDHPGVNQHFLISTSNHLAALYENSSVLENHHWRSAVGCLLESGVAEQLADYKDALEDHIKSLILATDITRQQEFITKFRKDLDENTLELNKFEDRHFILQIALKCADISNPTRPWDISHKWSLKVCQEFFRQGDYERKLNLPVTSLCDRQSTSVPKIQSGFFRFVVTPLFSEWHRFLSSTLSTHMMALLSDNQKRWEQLEVAEQAEETQTELSDAEPEEISEADEETRGSSETLLLPIDFIPRRPSLVVPSVEPVVNTRRHSVPVNNVEVVLPRTVMRRESLPIARFVAPEIRLANSRASSSHIREEDELRFGSQSSLLSSNSGGPRHSSEEMEERPLSAETLLPETSIASMTSSRAADRLNTVLHGGNMAPPTKYLTRQATFPPLQPYVRIRYMSTTAEMSGCSETLIEGGSKSNSSNTSQENIDKSPLIPTITILSPNNCRASEAVVNEMTNKIIQTTCNKRESETVEKEKASKIAKLSDSGQRFQKENVDPRKFISPALNIRRGSAPVTMSVVRPDENTSPSGVLRNVDRLSRRGSVPIEMSQQTSPEKELPRSELPHPIHVPLQLETYLIRQCPRRGSAPADSPLTLTVPITSERRDHLTRHTSLNGKASRRKKQLRRRSSGGPETVCAQEVLGQDVWMRIRRDLSRRGENPDMLLARRRGSLPIEVFTVGHSVC